MSVRALALSLVLIVASACTTRGAVLVSPDAGPPPDVPPITDCDTAFGAREGTRCTDFGRCARNLGACCLQELVCSDGALVELPVFCDPDCTECNFDEDCPAGRICDGTSCQPCPFDPSGMPCPECPAGLAPVVRNGCETCECLPRTECRGPVDCPPTLECIVSGACIEGCGPTRELCCANVCAPASCPFPAPLGCLIECPPELGCMGPCVTARCSCDGMSWRCEATCAPESFRPVCSI